MPGSTGLRRACAIRRSYARWRPPPAEPAGRYVRRPPTRPPAVPPRPLAGEAKKGRKGIRPKLEGEGRGGEDRSDKQGGGRRCSQLKRRRARRWKGIDEENFERLHLMSWWDGNNMWVSNGPALNIEPCCAVLAAQARHAIPGHAGPHMMTIRAWAGSKTQTSCQAVRPRAF